MTVATKGLTDLPAAKEHVAKMKIGKAAEDVDSPAVALALFDTTAVFGGWRAETDALAWEYFDVHVESALLALVPIAVGEKGPRRKMAERTVRMLATRHGDVVRGVGKRYGKRAVESLEEILAVDPRFDCPNAAPQMPATWRPGSYTRPRLRDGRALPLAAVEHIGHMLAFSTLDRRYEGLADVREVCEPRSIAELAWDMARAWEAAGAEKRDEWMIESLAHLGDDAVIRRTTPTLEHPHVLRVLGHAATDAAAVELCTIAWRLVHDKPATPRYSLAQVAAAFATVARRRGISVEQLEDSLSPTLPIAAPHDDDAPASSRLAALRTKSVDARVTVDYGGRPLVFGFDERLDPFVQTRGGTRLRELPRAAGGSDHDTIARARQVWRELQEDVAAIADMRIQSLERAMVSGRSWTLDAFRRAWLDHPLMQHVTRSVVWRSGATTFRIAEDGTFADVDDVELKGVVEITIAHPAEMTGEERTRWGTVFADYRLVQPLEQLARRVLGDGSTRVKGSSIVLVPAAPTGQAEIFERLRASRFEVTWRDGRQFASRTCARSTVRLGLTLALEKQMVAALTLAAHRGGTAIDLERVHPVDLSELVQDLGVVLSP